MSRMQLTLRRASAQPLLRAMGTIQMPACDSPNASLVPAPKNVRTIRRIRPLWFLTPTSRGSYCSANGPVWTVFNKIGEE